MGELVKECIIVGMDTLLSNHKNRNQIINEIKAIPLSRWTIARRCNFISNEIRKRLKIIIRDAISVGICLDESTDINDVAQLVVWIRCVSRNFETIDHILDLKPLTKTTKSEDIHQLLLHILENYDISLNKITSITTDGAATMTGNKKGVVGRIMQDNPKLIPIKCIIHQEALCAKLGIKSAKPFADFVMHVINKCISAGALRHRLLREFLKENESDIYDLPKMAQVRWLSCDKVFTKFNSSFELIKEFLNQQGVEIKELNNVEFQEKLCFFTDLTKLLADLNRSLQGIFYFNLSIKTYFIRKQQ